ncbi:MAG: hypothetical protein LAO24_09390 [Acidobacteriia bacterium]|nr:hypothetical protein [Terriglobia bacterium]
MKRTIRIAVLMFAAAGTYVVAAVPQVPALDGGPIMCLQQQQPQQQLQNKCSAKPPMQ